MTRGSSILSRRDLPPGKMNNLKSLRRQNLTAVVKGYIIFLKYYRNRFGIPAEPGKEPTMNTQTSAGSSPAIKRPSKQRAISLRGIAGLLLVILLPPVGLFFLWSQGVFRTRGRMLLTALATVEMMALCVILTPRAEMVSQLPLPVVPQSVTAAPADDNLSALYNIEQLIYEQQLAQVIAQGGDETDLMTEEQKLEQQQENRDEILNTLVYAVYNNAKLYHAQMVCGTQTNNRQLTVREAMMEALGPCPDCNPPVWTD